MLVLAAIDLSGPASAAVVAAVITALFNGRQHRRDERRAERRAFAEVIGAARAWRDDFWEAQYRIAQHVDGREVPEHTIRARPTIDAADKKLVAGVVSWHDWVILTDAERRLGRLAEATGVLDADGRQKLVGLFDAIEDARRVFHQLETSGYTVVAPGAPDPFVAHPCADLIERARSA